MECRREREHITAASAAYLNNGLQLTAYSLRSSSLPLSAAAEGRRSAAYSSIVFSERSVRCSSYISLNRNLSGSTTFLVERTEETTTKQFLREGSGKADVKGKGTLGSILAYFGLASLEVKANVSASGKVSFSKEVVSEFTPPQKLKALLLKLTSERRISNINEKELIYQE